MPVNNVDVLIIGSGIAGITLAWQLQRAGLTFAIASDEQPGASHAAAGLVTPVTGGALRVEPNYAGLLKDALLHYRSAETCTGRTFFAAQDIMRALRQPKELRHWAQHAALGLAYADEHNNIDEHTIDIRLRVGYRLDVLTYLDASLQVFRTQLVPMINHTGDYDLRFEKHAVHVPKASLRANYVVMCRGAAERHSALFSNLTWRCAKGEVLEVHSEAPMPQTRVHANGIWLSPLTGNTALLGATYSWDELDNTTTEEARNTLLNKARQITQAPLTVLSQRAGVRPIVSGRQPVAGAHPDNPLLMLLNGLGSKGSLYAPQVARALTEYLTHDKPIRDQYALTHRLLQPGQ